MGDEIGAALPGGREGTMENVFPLASPPGPA